jgi:mono/diheme cytochrome c family protein
MTRLSPLPPLLLLLLPLAACGQNLTMSDQQKYHEYERASLFRNGQVLQAAPAGTVSREAPRGDPIAQRPSMSLALVERGRERFGIFCAPCHGPTGDGTGLVVQRGMPRPPSFHDPRLVAAPDAHFVDVITNGHGAMYSYADRVPPPDRWAITAYVRALQRSQAESLDDVPAGVRARLMREVAR